MADVNISPNMNLPVPIPTQTAGPEWAQDLAACLDPAIDQHDHSPGKGVQITPAGFNINTDLSFLDNNLTNARTLRMEPQLTNPSLVTDIGCLSVVGNELYYNDISGGNQVQITNNGSVNAGAGSITGITGTASASYSGGTFFWEQATSTPANMDAAAYILRYPGSYPSPSGNYIAIEAPATLSGGYAFTLPASAPGSTSFLTMDSSGTLSPSISTSGGIIGSNIASATITGNKLVSNTVTNLQLAQTNYFIGSLAASGLTNTSPTLLGTATLSATSGTRAVSLTIGGTLGNQGAITVTNSGGLAVGPVTIIVQVFRNSTLLAEYPLTIPVLSPPGGSNTQVYPACTINQMDLLPPSGSNVYNISTFLSSNFSGAVSYSFVNCQLQAVEL